METKIDTLHHLITKMNNEEKRQFRMHLLNGRKKTQAFEIFELMNRMKTFDPKQFKAFVQKKKIENSVATIKSQLKEKLIQWLTYRHKAPHSTNWYYELSKGELLMQLELHEEATIVYDKVKREAYEKEYGNIELITLTPLSILAQFGPPENILKKMLEYSERLAVLSERLSAKTLTYNYYLRTLIVFYESRSINMASYYQMVQQLRRETFFTTDETFTPMEMSCYILVSRTLIYQMLGEWERAYLENTKLYNLLIQHENRFQTFQPDEYCLTLRDRLYYCLLSGHISEFTTLYPLFYNKMQTLHPDNNDYLLRMEVIYLLLLIKTGEINQIKKELSRYETFRKSPNWDMEIMVNRKESLIYAGYAHMFLGNWDKAILLFENILQLNVKSVGIDFDHTAHLMILLCRFADYWHSPPSTTEPSLFLIRQGEAYYNYAIRNKLETPVEKIIIKGIKDIASGGDKAEQKRKLHQMLHRIKQELLSPSPYYVMQLAEFNWIDWLAGMLK